MLAAGCGGDKPQAAAAAAIPPPQAEVDFASIDSPSLQFLPRHEEAQGWRLEEDPIVVPNTSIAQHVGSDASHFLRYEVVDLTAGKYTAPGSNGFATVEIFRFPDFVKAFGAYSLRKLGPIQFVPIENEAFVSKHSVHLWRGPFYVRVTGGGAADSGAALQRLTAFVAERMPPAPSKPAVFNFFPTDSRVPNTERYSADEAFGQPFLGNSFMAAFDGGPDPIWGLIIPAADKAAADRIIKAYRDLYVRNGKLLDPIPNLGEDNFTAEDRYLGRTVAFRIDRFVIAFTGFRDRTRLVDLAIATDARILGTIRKQLVTADKRAADAANPASPSTPQQPAWAQRP